MSSQEHYFKFITNLGGKLFFSTNTQPKEVYLDGRGATTLAVTRLKAAVVKLLLSGNNDIADKKNKSLSSLSELLPTEDFHFVFDKCMGQLRCRYFFLDDASRQRRFVVVTEPPVIHFWLYYVNFLKTEFNIQIDEPAETLLRYTVGERRVFLAYHLEGISGQDYVPFTPWEHTLNSIDLKTLICKEHHWVPTHWDEDPKHHGFLFQEENQDTVWFNQYPKAINVPNNDHLDYQVSTVSFNTPGRASTVYEDVTHTINRIIKGIRQFHETSLKFEIEPEIKSRMTDYEEALKEHLEDLVLFVQSSTGCVIKIEPLKVQYQDGRVETLSDVPAARLIWPETEDSLEEQTE